MAERNERLPQNVAGPYYVDSTCIDCDMCRSTAPGSFRRDEEIGMTIVYHQPVTPEEQALVLLRQGAKGLHDNLYYIIVFEQCLEGRGIAGEHRHLMGIQRKIHRS